MSRLIARPKKRTKNVVSAIYDKKSGLLQRTLNNGVTISILFASVGEPKEGKKGLYLDFPGTSFMTGQTFPVVVNNGAFMMPGNIKIVEYTRENHGSYRVILKVGQQKMEKLLKNHDLATLWCVATDINTLAVREEQRVVKKLKAAQEKAANKAKRQKK